ncbi:MAG TPA: hypothetical protein VHO06_13410 [Polyangia bacterium]|nr:hypothetical protein [Polyangia bacterium]
MSPRRRLLIAFAAVGALMPVVVTACQRASSLGALGEANDAPSRQDVELYGRVRLPPDAGDLRARLQTFAAKRTLLARFSIAPAELPALLASGGFQVQPATPASGELSVASKPEWWTPEAARAYVMGTADRAAILIDKDRSDRYVVYLVRHS